MPPLFHVIYEDAELLVVHKPADLVCHPTKGDEYSSLISRARIYLQATPNSQTPDPIPHLAHGNGDGPKPGQPTAQTPAPSSRPPSPIPHLVHRLDRETSGLVVIAKNPATARELGKIWETRAVRKEYLAIVHGRVAADHGD